jgi:hypothetical protein
VHPLAFHQFIETNLQANTAQLALKAKAHPEFDVREALEQIHCLQKAKTKLPTWYKNRCLFTRRALEQATAEEVAQFKAQLFKGLILYDLTGGLGVDDWAFAQSFDQVIGVDSDEGLNQLVRYNFERNKQTNIKRVQAQAEAYIQAVEPNSVVYLDPDRRVGSSRKLLLEECSPNVLDVLPELQAKGCTLLLKLSPLFEPTEVERRIPGVSQIFAIALQNELKELLVVVLPHLQASVQRVSVNITSSGIQQFAGDTLENLTKKNGHNKWFFEPNVALIKLKLWKAYANNQGLAAIHPETPYLIGKEAISTFQGRQFAVVATIEGGLKQMRHYLIEGGIEKANLAERNAGMGVDEIRKQLKLKDGGKDYLFFLKTANGTLLGIHARKG